MAKRKKARVRTRAHLPMSALPDHMQHHLSAVGHKSVESYLDWCREQGFPARWTNKSQIQRDIEAARSEEIRLRRHTDRSRKQRHPDRNLLRALDAWDAGQRGSQGAFCAAASAPLQNLLARDGASTAAAEFASALLRHVLRHCPDFLFEATATQGPPWVDAVARLADFVGSARRDIESWRPRSKNNSKRFASLARHLFADWEIPAFFDNAWIDDDPLSRTARSWFVHIAQGKNLRSAEGLPFAMTRKMAHATMQAPSNFRLSEALRWGQVLGFGGDARLAVALRGTKLAEASLSEPFWTEVVQFLARQPMFDTEHVGPIADYLHHIKFEETRHVNANGRTTIEPPAEPNFSLRGRTLTSVLRRVENWHEALGHATHGAKLKWDPSDRPQYRDERRASDGSLREIHSIRELCTSTLLQAEGRGMSHCVASYANACAAGRTSIWSLGLQRVVDGEAQARRSWVTIEVANATSTIVQARGRANRNPDATARAAMKRWAQAAQLAIADWV